MDDYALVLIAGSSSLKFCVFQRLVRKVWQVAGRGQIKGIGTSPRLSAKDAQVVVFAKDSLDAKVADGHAAIDGLASWPRSKWQGARVLGVGHRIVHGRIRYGQPVVMTREKLSDLHELIPLAPFHQPYNPSIAKGRVIVAHIGSGASLCALKDRKSVDSSLGFTALAGLCMGTRPGALGPGVVL